MSSSQHIAEAGQSIWDVAIQRYGSLDGVQYLLADNAWTDGFDHQLQAGEVVTLRSLDGLDDTSKSTVQAVQRISRVFNTGVPYVVSGGNCWVEEGWVEDGWVSCATDSSEIDIIEYYLDLLDELDILDEITLGRDVRIIATINAGETIFSTYVDSETKGTYTSIAGVNVDSYVINKNENPQTLPFSLEVGDELEVVIVQVDALLDSEITLDGTY